MKNLEIWIIALVIAVLLLVGIFYYGILGAVVNAFAFIISLTIIFLILILVIIFSQQNNKKRKVEKPQVEVVKGKTEEQKNVVKKIPPKELRVDRKK